ncbi:MAG TPA: hypothetical protein VEW94_03715 [Chloroflexia bacterium]|nr:hypothetical protein [Chloroflexia bacterium]
MRRMERRQINLRATSRKARLRGLAWYAIPTRATRRVAPPMAFLRR